MVREAVADQVSRGGTSGAVLQTIRSARLSVSWDARSRTSIQMILFGYVGYRLDDLYGLSEIRGNDLRNHRPSFLCPDGLFSGPCCWRGAEPVVVRSEDRWLNGTPSTAPVTPRQNDSAR